MASLDHLSTVAQVGIALAGFSALVAILRSRPGSSDPRLDTFRLQIMLESCLFVVALALFPLVLIELRVAEDLTWRVAAGVFLLFDVAAIPSTYRRELPLRALYTPGDRAAKLVLSVLTYSADAVCLLVLLGVAGLRSSGFYLLALYLGLLFSGILFVRFAASAFLTEE